MNKLSALFRRHAQALWYVLTVIVSTILCIRRRPVIFSRFADMGDRPCFMSANLKFKTQHLISTTRHAAATEFAYWSRLLGRTGAGCKPLIQLPVMGCGTAPHQMPK